MSRDCRTAVAAAAALAMFAAPVFAQGPLPWRLADYPGGGRALTGMVAAALTGQGELIGPTCTALKPGSVQQISSGAVGIAVAISDSDSDNAAAIVDGLPQCCESLVAADADTRIALGVGIALEARTLAGSDLRPAQDLEMIVSICEDDVLQRSYELARGQDNLGQLIAREGEADSESNPVPVIDTSSGGGLASIN